jgi:arylsulfatase
MGEIRPQYHHLIDVAPTVLEMVGLPQPKVVNGTPQSPMEGVSMAYSFSDAQVKSPHTVQYFEFQGNRGIYKDGWYATSLHKVAWEAQPRTTFDQTSGSSSTPPKTSAAQMTLPLRIQTNSRRCSRHF